MTYTPHHYENGDKLAATDLNRIEQGVADAHAAIDGDVIAQEIETRVAELVGPQQVESYAVVGDRLIVTLASGETLDAGDVRGPAGTTTVAGLTDATTVGKALAQAADPATARAAIGAVTVATDEDGWPYLVRP